MSGNVAFNTRPGWERSYGGTLTSDRASTSHLATNTDPRTHNAHAGGGDGGGGPLYGRANAPHLQRQDSSRTVRLNAVEDGAGALRRGVKFFTFSLVDIFLIVIGTVVLGLHWGDKPAACHSSHSTEDDPLLSDSWRQWALVAVVLKVAITAVCVAEWKLGERSENNEANARMIKAALDFLNFMQTCWSFFGVQLLLSSRGCDDRSSSPIYKLCLAFIILYFIPIVMILVLALALCCCLPSILGALQRLSTTGARQEEINELPIERYGRQEPLDESCAICLVEYDNSDYLRRLPCGHALHLACVDKWLAVNASCPICRAPCFTAIEEETDGEDLV